MIAGALAAALVVGCVREPPPRPVAKRTAPPPPTAATSGAAAPGVMASPSATASTIPPGMGRPPPAITVAPLPPPRSAPPPTTTGAAPTRAPTSSAIPPPAPTVTAPLPPPPATRPPPTMGAAVKPAVAALPRASDAPPAASPGDATAASPRPMPKVAAKVSPLPAAPAVAPFARAVPMPADDVIGQPHTQVTRHEDTLLDLAVQHGLGYLQVVAANPGIDPWLPGEGTRVVVPLARIPPAGARHGIVINMPERRLYHFEKGRLMGDYPVGLGRDGYETPFGATRVARKTVDPSWHPTASARRDDPTLPVVFPPGPDNPLGTRALYLGWPAYLIHGTNKDFGIGRRASRGCIRMYNAHVERLYEAVAPGTPVHVVDQPVKLGWRGGNLFVEAHPTLRQGAELELEGKLPPVPAPDPRPLILRKTGGEEKGIDWAAVDRALAERRGIPVQITNFTYAPAATVPDQAPSLPPVAQGAPTVAPRSPTLNPPAANRR